MIAFGTSTGFHESFSVPVPTNMSNLLKIGFHVDRKIQSNFYEMILCWIHFFHIPDTFCKWVAITSFDWQLLLYPGFIFATHSPTFLCPLTWDIPYAANIRTRTVVSMQKQSRNALGLRFLRYLSFHEMFVSDFFHCSVRLFVLNCTYLMFTENSILSSRGWDLRANHFKCQLIV